MCNIIQTIIIC